MTKKQLIYGNREHWAWYLYDFGNSAYYAVVILAVYSRYFQNTIVGGIQGTRLWNTNLVIAMLVSAVLSIILGPIADFSASKKRLLIGVSAVSWIFTALLFFVVKGDIFIGMLFYIMAEIGYRLGQVFYNGLLPEITTSEDMGRVSGNGWAIGSAGGIVCLLIVLPIILLSGQSEFSLRLSMVIAAVFFAVSAIPSMIWVKERAKPQRLPPGQNYLTIGFKRLGKTFKNIRHFREFFKYMIAYFIYNDGIMMAMDNAAIIGGVLYGMNDIQLIILMILVQLTSVFGAYLSAMYGERAGFKKALVISLILMIGTIIWMIFNQTLLGFFIIASLAGFALTGVQSVSRTMVGFFAPKGQSAEFFSFESVAGRTSSFIGPFAYLLIVGGVASWLMKHQGMVANTAHQFGIRAGLVAIAVFLIIGLVILATVNEKHGRQAAEIYAPTEE
jgi:UMF1 family MFS transporter